MTEEYFMMGNKFTFVDSNGRKTVKLHRCECGGKADLFDRMMPFPYQPYAPYFVKCRKCGKTSKNFFTIEAAIKLWR